MNTKFARGAILLITKLAPFLEGEDYDVRHTLTPWGQKSKVTGYRVCCLHGCVVMDVKLVGVKNVSCLYVGWTADTVGGVHWRRGLVSSTVARRSAGTARHAETQVCRHRFCCPLVMSVWLRYDGLANIQTCSMLSWLIPRWVTKGKRK